MSGAPGPPGARCAQEEVRAIKRPGTWSTNKSNSSALRAKDHGPARPGSAARGLRPFGPPLRARSRPPVCPRGAPCPAPLRGEINDTQKRGLHAVQAAESSCTAWPERVTPRAVKARPSGRAARGLDGFGAGSVCDGHRCHGAVVHHGPVPPGLPSACGRRQTRRDIGMGVGCSLADSRLQVKTRVGTKNCRYRCASGKTASASLAPSGVGRVRERRARRGCVSGAIRT
jgi:hypothetical protein